MNQCVLLTWPSALFLSTSIYRHTVKINDRSILPGLRRKITGLLLSGPKSFFQMKVNFAFHLEIKVLESEGREERHSTHVAWSPVWSFTVSDDVICWCWPTVFSEVNTVIYQDILESKKIFFWTIYYFWLSSPYRFKYGKISHSSRGTFWDLVDLTRNDPIVWLCRTSTVSYIDM